ncbi:MAG TPA: YidC/Oxa1 family membrane protein insertase [Gaiellaceae bacterium]|nr:YidC/Oxa1 family membrane protein insertase [Gaiellaceae bacterium]
MILLSVLSPIENVLEHALRWLHESLQLPWAWAIVALTLIVRMLLVPLTVRQIHSMQNLQKHAPEMKAIQARFKDDKVRQREELMAFYKENNINPAASCLPILAQIPIFISLYFVLKDFEKEVFPDYPDSDLGWLGLLPDITAPANSHWSGYLLIVVYAVSQLTSTLLMSTTMDRMQRTMLIVLPLAFVFVIVNFPAGLVLYWVTSNLWTTGQGLVTRQMMPKPAVPPKRTSRTPAKAEPPAKPEAKADGKAAQAAPRRVKRKKKKARR